MRGERPAAGNLAQHDAPTVQRLRQFGDRLLDGFLARLHGIRELVHRDGLRRQEQQRLDLAGEGAHDARTVIGPNGTSCSHAASPFLYSSSSANSVTATVTRSAALTVPAKE